MIIRRIERIAVQARGDPKIKAELGYRIKGWGKRRGEKALVYFIPNRKNKNKDYQKGVTVSEFEKAYKQIVTNVTFSRTWFKTNMQPYAKEGGCNFIFVGNIFKLIGIVAYDKSERRVYRRKGP